MSVTFPHRKKTKMVRPGTFKFYKAKYFRFGGCCQLCVSCLIHFRETVLSIFKQQTPSKKHNPNSHAAPRAGFSDYAQAFDKLEVAS